MATRPGDDKPVEELTIELARSRDRLARDLRGLRRELDLPGKLRRSFRDQPGLWIGAVAAVGVLTAIRLTRTKKVYVDRKSAEKARSRLLEAGFVLGALRIAAGLLKPVILNFVANKIRGYAGGTPLRKKH